MTAVGLTFRLAYSGGFRIPFFRGVFVKCEFVTEGTRKNAHGDSAVNVVLWEESTEGDKYVVSAGEDGYIRWWPFGQIDYL